MNITLKFSGILCYLVQLMRDRNVGEAENKTGLQDLYDVEGTLDLLQ